MMLSTGEIYQIIILVFGVGSVYGLIRNDLKNIHEKFGNVKEDIDRVSSSAHRAHERLDNHISLSHLKD